MAKNITLMGADYPQVPAVQLPQTGGGTATYYDINVVDDLNSDSSTDALSAKQGKVLKSNIDTLDGKLFEGCGSGGSSITVSDNVAFTVSKPGWLIVLFTPTAGQTIPSAGTLQIGANPIAMASGSNNVNVDFSVCAPVKPNVNYKVRAYRCSIKSATLYHN